jgi:hypothetical protein
MVGKATKQSAVGCYVNVSIKNLFDQPFNIDEVEHRRPGFKFDDEAELAMLDRFFVCKGRKKRSTFHLMLAKYRHNFSFNELNRGLLVSIVHDDTKILL